MLAAGYPHPTAIGALPVGVARGLDVGGMGIRSAGVGGQCVFDASASTSR